MRVAIVGGGIAGMGAARELLRLGAQVTVLESNPRLGGNCLGIKVPTRTGSTRIDAGVSDFNIDTFSRLANLLGELGVSHRPISQTASFSTPEGESRDPSSLQPEIDRFKRECVEVLEHHRDDRVTTEAYLLARGYSQRFGRDYLYPRASGCFSMPEADPAQFEIGGLVRFWKMHGLVGQTTQPRRHCVVGGMQAYVRALERDLLERGLTLHTQTRVTGVSRRGSSVEVRAIGGPRRRMCLVADHVVFAGPPQGTATLIGDTCPEEAELLAEVPFQRAEVFVHTDRRLMPADRSHWAAYNYKIADDASAQRPTITFFPNRIRQLGAEVADVFVTMNPHRAPDPRTVMARRSFAHPIASSANHRIVTQLDARQGHNNFWYCGSWMREPFLHENALASGQDLALRIAASHELVESAPQPSRSDAEFPESRREDTAHPRVASVA